MYQPMRFKAFRVHDGGEQATLEDFLGSDLESHVITAHAEIPKRTV